MLKKIKHIKAKEIKLFFIDLSNKNREHTMKKGYKKMADINLHLANLYFESDLDIYIGG